MQVPLRLAKSEPVTDRFRRPLRELRISVIDRWPLRPIVSNNPAETARRFEYLDGQGQMG